MIDVDHFKRFNDHYGHQAGDQGFRAPTTILISQALRPTDLPARYGGGEFAMLLPNTDLPGCERVGGRILDALHELSLAHVQNSPSKIMTTSIGAAVAWPATEGTASEKLLAAVDSAMYAAKNAGRDQLIVAGQVIKWPKALAQAFPTKN